MILSTTQQKTASRRLCRMHSCTNFSLLPCSTRVFRMKPSPRAEKSPRHTNHASTPEVPEYMMVLILLILLSQNAAEGRVSSCRSVW